jgi:hypothetical protein
MCIHRLCCRPIYSSLTHCSRCWYLFFWESYEVIPVIYVPQIFRTPSSAFFFFFFFFWVFHGSERSIWGLRGCDADITTQKTSNWICEIYSHPNAIFQRQCPL